MVVPQSITDLCNEVVEWMDPQRDAQFPFCDTYLMWHYFPPKYDIEVYNCTYPYWRTHGNTIMEDISTQGEFKETIEKIIIVRGTDKGIALPKAQKRRQAYYIVKGDTDIILGKSYQKLCQSLEVNDYKLNTWGNRSLEWKPRKEGDVESVGNLWNMNVHIKEGDILLHVTYYDD